MHILGGVLHGYMDKLQIVLVIHYPCFCLLHLRVA